MSVLLLQPPVKQNDCRLCELDRQTQGGSASKGQTQPCQVGKHTASCPHSQDPTCSLRGLAAPPACCAATRAAVTCRQVGERRQETSNGWAAECPLENRVVAYKGLTLFLAWSYHQLSPRAHLCDEGEQGLHHPLLCASVASLLQHHIPRMLEAPPCPPTFVMNESRGSTASLVAAMMNDSHPPLSARSSSCKAVQIISALQQCVKIDS